MCYNMPRMKSVGEIRAAFQIGLASARANLVPMVALWALAVVLMSAYCLLPGFARALEPLREWQVRSGWIGPFLNRVAFCGVLPGVFLLSIASIRPHRPLAVIVCESLWNGALGVAGDWSFRMLNVVFGNGTDWTTLLLKTAADQFVWTVLFIAPANAVFHFWIGRGFSFRRTHAEWPRHFYRELVAPNLVSNWCVWFPVQFTVFMFPLDLQIHMNGLVCAFWTLMCLQIGRRTK